MKYMENQEWNFKSECATFLVKILDPWKNCTIKLFLSIKNPCTRPHKTPVEKKEFVYSISLRKWKFKTEKIYTERFKIILSFSIENERKQNLYG